ncbi:MAG: hypothetical protein MI799_11095, partial [Desulfobacterales bacterium]|nr:hypothetical protein [Desulfobacterales bacterium]
LIRELLLNDTKTDTYDLLFSSISNSATFIKKDFPVPREPSSKHGSDDFNALIIFRSDELTTDNSCIFEVLMLSVRK